MKFLLNPKRKLVALFFALALVLGQLTAAADVAASTVLFCSEQGDPFNTCNGCPGPGSGCTCDSSGWWYSVCCCDAS